MSSEARIRPYHPDDLAQVKELEERIGPYRPEDQPEVEAMFERARQAEQRRDPSWMPLAPPPPGLERVEDAYLAFWVAEMPLNNGADQVVGMVGVSHPTMPSHLPLARKWLRRNDVVELDYLRVAPETRRRGLGTELNRTAIKWCRSSGFRTLVLNTTSAQAPALSLYRKLGFLEVGRSFTGKFELVWHELAL